MSLSLQNRRIDDVIVVTCAGRVVAGDEAAVLEKHVTALLPDEPQIVLNLHDVYYMDSGGVGLLVRLMNRTRTAHGDLKLCAVSERVREVLKITRLDRIFDVRATDADAVAAFRQRPSSLETPTRVEVDILCVEESADVGAYVCEILRQAGYRVIALDNLPDALTLFKGSRPKLVVINRELRAATGTWTADTFNALIRSASVIELPPDFGRLDAGEATHALLDQVRGVLGTRSPTS